MREKRNCQIGLLLQLTVVVDLFVIISAFVTVFDVINLSICDVTPRCPFGKFFNGIVGIYYQLFVFLFRKERLHTRILVHRPAILTHCQNRHIDQAIGV